ncbi:helix-turn-helix domain-containing protein, partial [Desulfobacter hydrogenophilus]
SQICLTTQETVSKWIDGWGKYQFDSLIDKPRPGRTPLIPGDKHDEVIDIVKKNPRQLKSAITEIEGTFGKKISVKTLKRIIKKNCVGVEDGNLSKANAMRTSSGTRKRKLKS